MWLQCSVGEIEVQGKIGKIRKLMLRIVEIGPVSTQ